MANSVVKLSVDDNSFNQKIKNAASSFASFGKSIASAGTDALSKFAKGLTSAEGAMKGFNAALKANAIGLVVTAAVEAGDALYKYMSGVYEAEEAQRKLNAEIGNTKIQLSTMKDDADFDIAIAKAAGKSSMELAKMRVEAAKARLAIADLNYDKVTAIGSKASKEQVDEARKMQQKAEQELNQANRARTILDIQNLNKKSNSGLGGGRGFGGGRSFGGGGSRPKQTTEEMLLSSLKKANSKIDASSLMDTTTTGGSELFRMLQAAHQKEIQNIPRDSRADFEAGQQRAKSEIERGNESALSYEKKQLAVADTMAGNLGNILSGLTKMGIELPEGLSAIVEGTQSIISIVTSIMTLVSIISTLTAVKSTPIVGWLLANGGIAGGVRGRRPIHAATGTIVPGNNYSGDRVPALVNSGELILNRAQQGNIASQLQGGGMQNMNLQAIVTGEQLRFILNTNSRRRGKGEYVTSTHQ